MKKFWKWKNQTPDQIQQNQERTLYLNGTIADESWFDDDITPQLFKDELNSGTGDITVWINSPGGDCVAAAQIYNMLKEYSGAVTVKIDGLAASAASVVAMAGDSVLMSPVSLMLIHNPSTIAAGDAAEMRKTGQMLDEVKESIINAYEMKCGLGRRELSKLMDAEHTMNANEALALGFIDGILYRDGNDTNDTLIAAPAAYIGCLPMRIQNSLMEKISAKCKIEKPTENSRTADELLERLNLIKNHF